MQKQNKKIMNMSEKTNEELLKLYTEQLEAGYSLGDILRSTANLPEEKRKFIVKELDIINKELKEKKEKENKRAQLITGIVEIVIACIVYVLAEYMFSGTSKVGYVATFNILLWIVSGVLLIKGVIDIIKGR